jgi:hypothetical protein
LPDSPSVFSAQLQVCRSIHALNIAAGGVLPREEIGKWRIWPTTEASWRARHLPEEDLQRLIRPLSSQENQQFIRDIDRIRARNQLREFLKRHGLAQYLLLPATLFATVYAGAKRPFSAITAMSCLVSIILLFCGYRMMALDYYFSLGQ